ncbi:hypothetical protein SELMODRAFT_418594 [Selaginella moellendorffii]|uniref:Protein kinase domain-containing protein n=1 Tax=Selaginella moellendorffii TaxID=88036 RepID=D8S674_SELML|nr:hypothetical protein SELMODRAFT_418594 [Selaginella moellendorffii]
MVDFARRVLLSRTGLTSLAPLYAWKQDKEVTEHLERLWSEFCEDRNIKEVAHNVIGTDLLPAEPYRKPSNGEFRSAGRCIEEERKQWSIKISPLSTTFIGEVPKLLDLASKVVICDFFGSLPVDNLELMLLLEGIHNNKLLRSLALERPPLAVLPHYHVISACTQHARIWLGRYDLRISYDHDLTYDRLGTQDSSTQEEEEVLANGFCKERTPSFMEKAEEAWVMNMRPEDYDLAKPPDTAMWRAYKKYLGQPVVVLREQRKIRGLVLCTINYVLSYEWKEMISAVLRLCLLGQEPGVLKVDDPPFDEVKDVVGFNRYYDSSTSTRRSSTSTCELRNQSATYYALLTWWLGQAVAVKVFKRSDVTFEREVAALVAPHPHVLQVIGYLGAGDGDPVVVMDGDGGVGFDDISDIGYAEAMSKFVARAARPHEEEAAAMDVHECACIDAMIAKWDETLFLVLAPCYIARLSDAKRSGCAATLGWDGARSQMDCMIDFAHRTKVSFPYDIVLEVSSKGVERATIDTDLFSAEPPCNGEFRWGREVEHQILPFEYHVYGGSTKATGLGSVVRDQARRDQVKLVYSQLAGHRVRSPCPFVEMDGVMSAPLRVKELNARIWLGRYDLRIYYDHKLTYGRLGTQDYSTQEEEEVLSNGFCKERTPSFMEKAVRVCTMVDMWVFPSQMEKAWLMNMRPEDYDLAKPPDTAMWRASCGAKMVPTPRLARKELKREEIPVPARFCDIINRRNTTMGHYVDTTKFEALDAWLDSAEVDTLNASREKIKKFPSTTFPLEISGSQRSGLLMRWSLEICYIAPEYAMTGHLLVKSDVYRYGVVLLGLLSGRSRSTCPSHPRSPPAGRLSQASHAVVQALKLMYNGSDASDGIVSGNGSMPRESQQQDVKSGGTYASGGGGGGGDDERIRTVARHGWESGSFNSIDYDSRTFGGDRAGKPKLPWYRVRNA